MSDSTTLLSVIAIIFFLIALYFGYARCAFSEGGGRIQSEVQDLLLDRMAGWERWN